jgi:hypothetical protein
VHDIWRAAAPAIDILAPDLYIQEFDEAAERFTRNGNPLFIPETSANPNNVLAAFGKFNAIGFSPFFIERGVGPETDLAAAYRVIAQLAPMIAAQQGKDSITAVRVFQGEEPVKVKLGGQTLEVTYVGSRVPIAPEPGGPVRPAQTSASKAQATAILIAAGPDEYYFGAVGGGVRIGFTPATPGPAVTGLGDVQQGKFVAGKWRVVRQLGGDDTGQGEILTVRQNFVLRVTVYRYE